MNTHPFSAAERISETPRRARSKVRAAALDRQTLAALGTASVDDLAATSGLHANAKAVGALATGNGRLVSTFHVALTWQRINRASIAESAMAGGSKIGFRGTRYLNRFSFGRQ